MAGGLHETSGEGFRSLLGARPLPGQPDARCLIVGEVAQAHDGSLGTAHAFIDAIATAGADAVKFQTHIAGAESTPGEPWRVRFSVQDESRYSYWRRMEFTEEQWHGLQRHAIDRGLLFLSSASPRGRSHRVRWLVPLCSIAWQPPVYRSSFRRA